MNYARLMQCKSVLTVIQDREPLGILPLNECSLSFKVLSGLRTIILAKFDKSALPLLARAPPSHCPCLSET